MKIRNIILHSLLGLGLLGTANAGINDGLIAHYPFNGDINDVSGNGNNGIKNGNIGYTQGIVGQGVRLHGVLSAGGIDNPDFIRVPNSPSLALTSQLSVSYHVRIDGNKASSTSNRQIVNGIYGSVLAKRGDRFGFYFTESETSSSFGINQFKGGAKSDTTALVTVQNRFRHVVYTINGNTINVYIDGNLASSAAGIVDFTTSNQQDLYIGVQNNVNSSNALEKPAYWYPIDGAIDDLRLYNRVISNVEINQLKNSGTTNETNSNTLFNFAEQSFPEIFTPSGQATFSVDGFLARYYPATDTYVGTNGNDVYVLGSAFGGLKKVGKISDFISVIE